MKLYSFTHSTTTDEAPTVCRCRAQDRRALCSHSGSWAHLEFNRKAWSSLPSTLTQETKAVVGHWGELGKEDPPTWELEVRTGKKELAEATEYLIKGPERQREILLCLGKENIRMEARSTQGRVSRDEVRAQSGYLPLERSACLGDSESRGRSWK